jgi:hypothetical protein
MAKVWVLDTETKGTGATMVPLEQGERRGRRDEPSFLRDAPEREAPPPEPGARPPRRFRLLDVLTREVLGEDVDLRGTVALLRDVRSLVDVRVSVWEPERERWRLLTLGEQRSLWDARERLGSDAG